MNIPVFIVHEDKARDAYLAYLALLAHEHTDPELVRSSTWAELKALALSRYTAAHQVAA